MLFLFLLNNLLIMPLMSMPHNNVVIDSKLIYLGKQVFSPRITTIQGSKAIVSQVDSTGKTKFNLELKPLSSTGSSMRLEYTLLIKDAKNEVHSHGIVHLTGDQKGLIFLDKGRVQIQLKVNRS